MAELFNLETQNPESIILPAAEFVTDAALVRHNDDLILTLPDGREQVVEGYFAADPRPTLTLEDSNAALTPELVQSFLQEITFSGEGSATATDSQGNAIGNVETVIGEVTALRNGAKITLEAGDLVFQGDIIETETAGSAKLRFIDETVFSISEDARLALDKMVFDPETAEGETILSMLKGGFLFISGQIAKTDPTDMQVVTPVATIGIRGTIVTGNVSPGESFEFSVVDGAIAVQPQGSDEPIVMDSAFATLGGSVSESGAITTQVSQDSARAVIERNAGQFATLSDADVAAIETAVTATAVQNGETVTLDLQDLIEEVVTEATADDAQDDQDTVTESPVVETSPVNDTVTDDLGDDLGNETGDIDVSPVEPVTGTGDGNTEETPQDDDDDGPVTVEIPVTVPVINVLSGAISRANAILSGTAQAGTTIIVIGTLNGVEEQSFSTTTSGNGTWSVNLGADSNFEPNGDTYSYSVTATDSTGTTSAPATTTVILDFVNPDAPMAATLDQTSTDVITVSGDYSAEPGITMVVELKGSLGNTVSDEVTVKTDGTWSIGFSGLLSGTYEASVSAKDEAGNTSGSVDATISTTSTITSYIEDWSSLTEGGTANYSTSHTSAVTITTSSHADNLTTTDYNDTVTSSSGNDTIITGDGNDEIYLTYDNYVSGDRPTSTVNAGAGDDTVIVSDKAIDIENTGIALEGGAGADTLVIYDEKNDDTVATTTGDTQIKGFETIILVDETEYDSGATDQKKITFTDASADNNNSYYLPKGSFDADGGLTLQGSMTANSIDVENGMDVVWKDSNESNGNANTANSSTIDTITLSSGTLSSDTHLTLQANGSLTGGAAHDFVVTDSLTLEAGTTLTLQADDNSATLDQNGVPLNGMSRILKVGDSSGADSFFMDRDATLAIDFLNLSGNDLLNASNVIDLYDDASNSNANANFAGALHIHANDAINYADGTGSQTMIRTYGSSYSTFDEILFLGADGSNLVGAEDDGTVSSGTDNALVAIYTDNNGIQLKAVTANEVNEATFDAATDGAYFSTTETTVSATATTNNTDGVAFYGSNNHADTFVISSAEQIAYFDGGSGDHNDTLKITDNAIQFSDIYDTSNTDDVMDFQINRIETLDISGNDAYETTKLDLSVQMVKALTEDTNAALNNAANALIVKVGNGNMDKVDLSGWGNSTSVDVNGTTYSVYETTDTDGNVARLYVDKSGQ